VVSWTLVFTKQAQKDAKKLVASGLKPKAERLLEILERNPYQNPPPYEKLVGDLAGACSRRINIQHRLVYQVQEDIKTVKIIRLWTHYE
jgi:Txe/YoeB family toxin of toxin-antitoxin system